MRDPSEIYTKRGTPIITVLSRLAFLAYFLFAIWSLRQPRFLHSQLHLVWILYLLALYILAEYIYQVFLSRGIDLTFAFPILISIFTLNLVAQILGGQEKLPLLNRAEHFASFVLLTYIIWVFFIKYLPQQVWHEHPYYTALLVMSVASFAGVLNELAELLLDSLFTINLVGSHLDTSLDLLMNTLGGGIFLAVRLILGESSFFNDS